MRLTNHSIIISIKHQLSTGLKVHSLCPRGFIHSEVVCRMSVPAVLMLELLLNTGYLKVLFQSYSVMLRCTKNPPDVWKIWYLRQIRQVMWPPESVKIEDSLHRGWSIHGQKRDRNVSQARTDWEKKKRDSLVFPADVFNSKFPRLWPVLCLFFQGEQYNEDLKAELKNMGMPFVMVVCMVACL